MRKKKQKVNPHCPVRGCRTKKPHMNDSVVQAISRVFSDPARLTEWFKGALAELGESMQRDLQEKRFFGYLTRWRQPEELYYRALYVLFLAETDELPHVFSGETPNGFPAVYRAVNREILADRGTLETPQHDLNGGEFTVMDTLNDSAHVSFKVFLTCIGVIKNPTFQQHFDKHLSHIKRYCEDMHYMEGMFKAGKSKADVLVGIKNMHKPAAD